MSLTPPALANSNQDIVIVADYSDAQTAQARLESLVDEISVAIDSSELRTEEDYKARISPLIATTTEHYQALGGFLQQNKHNNDRNYRSLQRAFAKTMLELQQVQRLASKKREELCEAEFINGSKYTALDVQMAKEELLEAHEIAKDTAVIKELFQEVGALVHQQGKGIDDIVQKVDQIQIEIGRGISELEQAKRLQREARSKYCICVMVVLLIAVIIGVALVLHFT